MSKIIAKRKEIDRRLAVLDKLLSSDATVHPPGCSCAIKSRDETHHAQDCPYRMLKELAPLLRAELETTTAREHVESKDCWCHPTLDYVDPETGCEVWIHHKGN
jgi:hypothetical protein